MSRDTDAAPPAAARSHDGVGDLRHRVLFESLLADISTRLLNVETEAVDAEIGDALRDLGRHLEVDRGAISTVDPTDGRLRTAFSWSVEGIAPVRVGLGEIELPWAATQMRAGLPIVFSRAEEIPPEAEVDRATIRAVGVRSAVLFPLSAGGRLLGTVHFSTVSRVVDWPSWLRERLRLIGEIFAGVLLRRANELELRAALERVQALTERLAAENTYLRADASGGGTPGDIVGRSEALRMTLQRVARVAPTEATVLILGETGVGKELIAKAIHERSRRNRGPFVKVNCAALPATLIESELFGHEKGAFSGAVARKLGRFEIADGGSLFLDEIGELPLDLQAKLLRVLQDGDLERLGAQETRHVDVRVIAATNRDLQEAAASGSFRPDLYYRLSVFPIVVPPLRERRADIPSLVDTFVLQLGGALGKSIVGVPATVMDRLTAYDWPGNVRELRNVIERALILSNGEVLSVEDLPDIPHARLAQAPGPTPTPRPRPRPATLEEIERAHIVETLEACGWRIRGPGQGAERLGLHPSTLYSRMKKLGIRKGA